MITKEQTKAIRQLLVAGRFGQSAIEPVEFLNAEFARLNGEVERLKGLVKDANWQYDGNGKIHCPYCGVIRVKENGGLRNHGNWCKAFTPDGDVK